MKRCLVLFYCVLVLTTSLIGIAEATPNLRIVTWDGNRGRTDMILTDTKEGVNIENVYNGLMNPANFGSSGISKCDPKITYVSAISPGSLVSGGIRQADIFFGNQIDPNDPVIPLSSDEAAELASFINAGGVAYISGMWNGQGKTWDPLFTALGVSDHFNSDALSSGTISLPLVSTPITNGPFGDISGMYMGWSGFSSITTSSLTTVIKAGGNPATYTFLAEGAYGAGRLSASGGVIAHDYISGSTANMRYMLNLFALGCHAPKLQVYQTIVPEVVTPGQPVTITLHVANLSESAINNVVISDIIPVQFTALSYTSSGLTLIQQTGSTYTWQAGTLAGQASGTITISGTVAAGTTAGTTITNLATISGTDGQSQVSDSSSFAVTVQDCYATADNGATVYHNLQDAVDVVPAGSILKVAGYCAGVKTVNNETQTVYIDKALTLRGGYSHSGWVYDPLLYPTTIDPLHLGRGVTIGAVSVTLRDLTVQNGRTLGNGGGIYALENSSLTLQDMKITNNSAVNYSGGGLYTRGTLTATGTQFIGNSAVSGAGGAMIFLTDAVITGGLFQDNRAYGASGGGLECDGTINLTGTRFIDNSCATWGGGVFIYGTKAGHSRIENALFAGNSSGNNRGSAIVFHAQTGITGVSGDIVHTTITGYGTGTPSAIYTASGTLNIENCIIDGYSAGIYSFTDSSRVLSEDYNLFNVVTQFDGYGAASVVSGGHSLTGNPKFVDSTSGDYHLLHGSPAIDHAVNLGVTTDLDGNPRPSGVAPDMGAYEAQPLLPVRIAVTPAKYYSTVKQAHDNASDGNTIEAQEGLFPEVLHVSKCLTLKGGFDSGYEARPGFTSLQGLIIETGSLTVDVVAVR